MHIVRFSIQHFIWICFYTIFWTLRNSNLEYCKGFCCWCRWTCCSKDFFLVWICLYQCNLHFDFCCILCILSISNIFFNILHISYLWLKAIIELFCIFCIFVISCIFCIVNCFHKFHSLCSYSGTPTSTALA